MKKTDKIKVKAVTSYIAAQSDPAHHKFVWSYDITITNEGSEIVQLLHRYWRITDMTGKVEEVHGAGVVGLQPLIKPGREFTYTSYCQLTTPQGTMEGHYEIQNLEEEHFSVAIPKFILSAPSSITKTFRSRLH
ncbi:Co2+/Mg2+ efflux protein ApaG [Aquicella lusitana]|uniref:Protein ApaG n=1 Tax=Aquicella lusitana TaxID=254246 RepID=A0A370G7Q3_9COXI|nr:Co2+/Mg2+ efflux protein ApaG [Aquicella lusitana]RDI39832.1 ApaG protein [Aquicella lusitana]VVC73147.1 Protein ApaG [Aquicella lusitana]